ncbi:3-hydroxyacyl-CoA dehydrogenase [Sphingobium jiangsuense]|uniref:3-hydroxyacyl-CoA dehydrogenase NAD-binding domain-containing protein n=1 Tax=Sphingobium jiangsuense TaxID=870476 RepID=UPI00235C47B6|nr:3-hydroxyacyl-CoA dehydrogenase NAD-binding domain-containing protein [Sphingobium jiangsuense]GLS99426.1 3-hydroxyacyl-CoA dehydrogenase [Sphingobium jiangsuense]
MSIDRDSTVAVIGAGAMGSGIAQVAALSGHRAILIDASEAALDRSRAGIMAALDKLAQRGRFGAGERDAALRRLRWSTALEDAGPAALTIEAIVEDMQAKRQLFARLEGVVGADAVLASNTSSLPIAGLSAGLARPDRFLGLHFFNPVPAMKLVEVIAGPDTAPSLAARLSGLMEDWGKVPVRVRDVPGFIVNRVARPYYAEGFLALAEGIAPQAVDHALEAAGSFRMGPLALTDMIGHDVNHAVARSVYDAYAGETRFRPQPAQRALVDAGKLGRKSGAGVYDHRVALPAPDFIAPGEEVGPVAVAADHRGILPLVSAVRDAGMELAEARDLPVDSLRIGAATLAPGDGRPLSSRPDVAILLDHVRDFAAAPTWVVTTRGEADAALAAAFAARLGKRLIAIPDRPGQIVLRTLAQLANAAADAVTDAVAEADGIDAAMRFGANHPEGPLAWARRIGPARLAGILRNIADATGDPLYAPSPLFGQGQWQ